MKKKEIDMINGPLMSSLVRFVLPVIATGVLQVLYNAADIVIVGQFAGPDSVAVGAIGSTTALINLIVGLFMGLSTGINVALAMSIGRGDDKGSNEVVHTSIALAIISGIFLLIVGALGSHKFLELMKSPSDVIDSSDLYLRIYFLGMPASMVYNFGSAVLRSKGETKKPFYYLMVSGVANVLLNIFFVAVCRMDVAGVAIATIVSQYISALLVLYCLMKQNDCCKLSLKNIRVHTDKALTILRYGIPAGLTSIMFNISNVFIQSSLNSFDNTDMMTGSAAAGSIEGIAYTAMNAFNLAAVTFVGQNVGARNYKRISKIFMTCFIMVVVIGLVLGNGLYMVGKPLLKLYAPNAHESAIEYGLVRMSCILVYYFIDGMLEVEIGVVRGMGYSVVPTIITILGVCVYRIIWLCTVFEKYHTMKALYMCYPTSWCVTVVTTAAVYFILKRRMQNVAT